MYLKEEFLDQLSVMLYDRIYNALFTYDDDIKLRFNQYHVQLKDIEKYLKFRVPFVISSTSHHNNSTIVIHYNDDGFPFINELYDFSKHYSHKYSIPLNEKDIKNIKAFNFLNKVL